VPGAPSARAPSEARVSLEPAWASARVRRIAPSPSRSKRRPARTRSLRPARSARRGRRGNRSR
jgi:hypothetical protein